MSKFNKGEIVQYRNNEVEIVNVMKHSQKDYKVKYLIDSVFSPIKVWEIVKEEELRKL